MPEKPTKDNFIKIELTTNGSDTMTCLVCHKSESLPTKDQIVTTYEGCGLRVDSGNGYAKTLKLPLHFFEHFKKRHLESCFGIPYHKFSGNKKAAYKTRPYKGNGIKFNRGY